MMSSSGLCITYMKKKLPKLWRKVQRVKSYLACESGTQIRKWKFTRLWNEYDI